MNTANKVYFDSLDSLRFYCFLSVFLYHSFFTEKAEIANHWLYQFTTRNLFANGNLGVNFFFVLSGFLITYLLIMEKQKYGKIKLGSFWMRRILRIWPLYFACVVFGFIIFPWLKSQLGLDPNESANPIFYFLFISNFDIINNGLPDASVLGVLWSIAIEEQFYLVWPLILFILKIRHYWIVFVLIIVQSIVFRFISNDPIIYEYHTLSCISDMAIGGLFAWLAFFYNDKVKFLGRGFWILSYVVFLIFFFFRRDISELFSPIEFFDRIIIAFAMGIIIYDQSLSKKPAFRIVTSPRIKRLGQISYGLYSLHFIGILTVTRFSALISTNEYLFVVLIVETLFGLLLTILLAEISWKYLEKPFLEIKKRFSTI